jgi:hypothetical protein
MNDERVPTKARLKGGWFIEFIASGRATPTLADALSLGVSLPGGLPRADAEPLGPSHTAGAQLLFRRLLRGRRAHYASAE